VVIGGVALAGEVEERIDWMKMYSSPEAAFGEVYESNHTGFKVRAYKYGYEATPEYGSLIVINCGSHLTVGLVYYSEMLVAPGLQSIPVPMKASREQVKNRYPDLEDRLIDTYHAISIGWYSNGHFYQSRPRRKPLIHDLAFIPSDEFIREFHHHDGYFKADYIPLVVHALGTREFMFLAEAFFSSLAEKFSVDERVSLFKSISTSMARWGVDSNISLVLDRARKILLEGL